MTAKKTSTENEQGLISELRHLRTISREVAENFILRCEADIETVLSCLSSMPRGTLRQKTPEWGKLVTGLKLKPGKGRLKDLKDLHNVVEKLLADVLEESERKPKKKGPQRRPDVPKKLQPLLSPLPVEPAAEAQHHPSPEIS